MVYYWIGHEMKMKNILIFIMTIAGVFAFNTQPTNAQTVACCTQSYGIQGSYSTGITLYRMVGEYSLMGSTYIPNRSYMTTGSYGISGSYTAYSRYGIAERYANSDAYGIHRSFGLQNVYNQSDSWHLQGNFPNHAAFDVHSGMRY